MQATRDPDHAHQAAAFRLLLTAEIFAEVEGRAPRDSEGKWGPGVLEDCLRLKSVLPMPFVENDVLDMILAIRMVLGTCQSEVVRQIPPELVAHRIRKAFQRSQNYEPTADEVMPLI